MRRISLFIFIFLSLGFLSSVSAETYYVDFDNGNDSNDGLSQSTAWLNIPGTRTTNGNAYLNNTWANLSPGDTILIKSGTTHSQADGGYIQIASTSAGGYYGNGSPENPITIKRDTTWGNGVIIIDGTGMSVPTWWGLVIVHGNGTNAPNYIKIDGAVNKGIIVKNSAYNGVEIYDSGASGFMIQNVEIYNSAMSNLFIESNAKPTTYISDITIDNVVSHDPGGGNDSACCINVIYGDNVVISNCETYNAPSGADGIHLGSCKNSWVIDCIAYNNGEQGIDLSKEGGYKTRDDAYNNTVRGCITYSNYKTGFDCNSGHRDTYFINNTSWETTYVTTGDGNGLLYEGASGPTFWINCTTSKGQDWGYGFKWDGNMWDIPSGAYNQYIINSISSDDIGASVHADQDVGSVSFVMHYYNSDFNSVHTSSPTFAVNDKGTKYTRDNINNGTGGWTGVGCIAKDPMFIANGNSWESTDLNLQDSSPCIDAGAFPFTTQSSGSGTVIILNKIVSEIDARRVFRTGDKIQIEGSGEYTILSVDSSNQITITSSASWGSGKGIWFPWFGQKPDMGALEYWGDGNDVIPPTAPTGLMIVN